MNKKKKIIGVAAVLAVCLAIAIPVGRGKFNFDDKFKIAGNFKANSSKMMLKTANQETLII